MKKDIFIIGLAAAVILLWNLGTGSLCSWDEGVYGAVAKEILKTGDWVNLHWMGIPWSDKPPLYMWVTAFFYRIFGFNEFSVRLFSSLCGIGTVMLTYLFANILYSRKAALVSALALLSSWHFIWSAKMGMLDITLTFFVTLSLFTFILGENNKLFLFFCPMAFACAFLTKGMGAMIVPIILSAYIIFSGKYKILKTPSLLAGIVISAAVLAWWHWTEFVNYGQDFVDGYFVQHLFSRTTKALDGHTGNILTYIGVIPNKGRPWALIGLCLLPVCFWRIVRNNEKEHIIPVIWASVVLLIFSIVKTKLHWYIMPLYPALAIMTGWGISKLLGRYTVAAAVTMAFLSMVYLTMDKDIFDLDYSPGIKKLALQASDTLPDGEKILMYGISDPGMQFYLEDSGKNIQDRKEFTDILKKEKRTAMVNKEHISILSDVDYSIVIEDDHFTVIRSK